MIPVGPNSPGRPDVRAPACVACPIVRRRPVPIDAAEAFRDLPGLALLESARPAGTPLDVPDGRPGRRPRAPGGRAGSVRRGAAPRSPGSPTPVVPADAPRFLGGLVGFLGYDLGHVLERLPAIAPDDQGLPPLRLALHDWVVAWDRRTGDAWLGGRALDGDPGASPGGSRTSTPAAIRRAESRRGSPRPRPSRPADPGRGLPSGPACARRVRGGCRARSAHIARGDIYQANLTRRLEAPFAATRGRSTGGCGPATRRCSPRTSTSGRRRRPVGRARCCRASPEPFLSVDADGVVASDPIKGTRPRGRDRAEDRALACELLASDKDRAENVMIVDVLRNDLGRVCDPGTVRVRGCAASSGPPPSSTSCRP